MRVGGGPCILPSKVPRFQGLLRSFRIPSIHVLVSVIAVGPTARTGPSVRVQDLVRRHVFHDRRPVTGEHVVRRGALRIRRWRMGGAQVGRTVE